MEFHDKSLEITNCSFDMDFHVKSHEIVNLSSESHGFDMEFHVKSSMAQVKLLNDLTWSSMSVP